MSAVKEEVVPAVVKEVPLKDFKVNIDVKPTTKLEGDKLVVSFDENSYLENVVANGLTENQIKKVQKFHSEFIKGVVKATGEELLKGYQEHKDATGFDMNLETTLGKVTLFGDKHTTHTVKGVEYNGTGMSIKHKYTLPGVKASIQASKAVIFASFK